MTDLVFFNIKKIGLHFNVVKKKHIDLASEFVGWLSQNCKQI